MPLVSLSGASVSFGERKLLESVNLTVATSARIALVGPNGSGKSTLMRIMAGQMAPDAGSVILEKETRVSYVPQSGVVHEGCTLWEEADKAFGRGRALVQEIAAVEERLAALSSESSEADALLWKHHALQEQVERLGYHRREEAMHRVLTGLGFSRKDFTTASASFSAGWQMRIALARAILETPDILLLDEPTNYLDIEARNWLEGFLADFAGGLLLVSHDRYFLDVVVSAVAEIYMSRVSVFTGNYSHYEETRSKELASILERWRAQQEEIAHTEAFIRRFRYNASKARMVQSRITALAKMERIEVPPVVKSIHFAFPAPPGSGRIVLTAAGLAKSYGDHRVFSGVGVEVSRGDKLVVVGVNGAGKSTLLRIISGGEPADAGSVKLGAGVIPAFYSQENADAWTSDRQVIEELEDAAPTPLIPELRTLLGAFLFRGDDVFKPVAVLSGGEKSRLALLMLLLRPANLLILDEPTNHLDIASKDVLLRSLREFSGTVIFVSHDRHFISGLATAVLEVKGGCARFLPGDYEYYLRKVALEQAAAEEAVSGAPPASAEERPVSAVQRERQEEKKLKSELRALEKEEGRLMQTLEDLEEERHDIEGSMARPDVYANGERMRDLRRQAEGNHERHASATMEWERLDQRIRSLRQKIESLRTGAL
ncbi:MAG: ribosomal protection-like ABC-F family protein [Spirochaetia bacterium]|jgi:ATP-binding cassette subfamily F protein 3